MKNLKDNIWIEGFDNLSQMWDKFWNLKKTNHIYYAGAISEVNEDEAKKYVYNYSVEDPKTDDYKNYKYSNKNCDDWGLLTAKKSIQSACPKEYCIIFRK